MAAFSVIDSFKQHFKYQMQDSHYRLDALTELSYSSIVPSTSKNAGPPSSAKAGNLPFEDALKKLEAIVEAMESQDLSLETLLAKYEEGTTLAKICQEKLAEAEVKIQQLERNQVGDLNLKPIRPDESASE